MKELGELHYASEQKEYIPHCHLHCHDELLRSDTVLTSFFLWLKRKVR